MMIDESDLFKGIGFDTMHEFGEISTEEFFPKTQFYLKKTRQPAHCISWPKERLIWSYPTVAAILPLG